MGGDYGGTRGREPPLNFPGEGGSWLSEASGGLLPLAPLRGVMSEEEGCRRRSPKRCNSVGGPVPRMGRIFHVSVFCRRSDIERGRPSTAQFLISSFLQTAHDPALRQSASCSHATFSTCCLEKARQVRNGGQGKRRRCVRASRSEHVEG